LKNQINHTKDFIFQIKYQAVDFGEGSECMPVEIKPSGVSMQNYDIRFDDRANKILEIRHKHFGLIKYESVRIDEECGYVNGSCLTVYTSVYKDGMLNIVHIHLNDMSE
jgi:hypothetical protein